MKNILLVVAILLFTDKAFAQDLETKLFKLVCKGFVQTDSFVRIKSNVKDVFLVADPINDSTYIQYPQKPWRQNIQSFSKYSREKQMIILNADPIPIIPFETMDTVYIVDTLYFFSRGEYATNGKYFKLIINGSAKVASDKKAYLHGIAIRKDEIILSFTFSASDLLYSVHMLNSKGILSFDKTSVLNLMSLKRRE